MGHPFLADGVDFGDVIMSLVMVVVSFVICLVATMLMVWFVRKVDRPSCRTASARTVAGPFGLLQTLADGVKLPSSRRTLSPDPRSDRFVFRLAPYLSLVPGVRGVRGGAGGRQTSPAATVGVVDACSATRRSCGRWRTSPLRDLVLVLAMCSTRRVRDSCSPGGPRARSTRCWGRSVRRPRPWSRTRQRSVCPSPR